MAPAKQISLHQAEEFILGINHCLAGKMIAEKWKLSETLGDAIHFHHSPGDAVEENRQVTTLVSISNIYANILEMGSPQGLYTDKEILTNLFDSVGIDWSTLSDIRNNVINEIEKARIFLEVSDKG
jgi:HD-like signal output (HDOD) protein